MAARQDKQVTHLSVQIVARIVEVSVPVVLVVEVVAGHRPCGSERVSEGKSELNRPKAIAQKLASAVFNVFIKR